MFNYTLIEESGLIYYPIAPTDTLPRGERLFVEIAGNALVILNTGKEFVAFGDLCTHDQGPLGDGDIEEQEIICPRHGARFHICTGKATGLPAVIDIPAYPVRVVEGMIEVGIPKQGD